MRFPSVSTATWRRQGLVVAASCCLGLFPLWAHGAEQNKPSRESIEAEARKLQRAIDSRRAVLDSLAGLEIAVPDSLTEAVQSELESLQERLEVERERLQELQEKLPLLPGSDTELLPPRPPRRKMVAYNMIRFGEDVEVSRDETVNGDAIIVGGDLMVQGEVDGDAIVIAGNLQLGRNAMVRGQAIAVGGRVETNAGAVIEGQTVSLTLFPRRFPWFPGAWPPWVGLVLDLLKLAFLVLVSGLLLALVSDRLLRARELLADSFLRCFGVGLLVLMGGSCAVTVTVILLAVTLVGIPAALVLAFAVALLFLASLLVGVLLIGDRLQEMLHQSSRAPLYSVLLGLALVLLPEIIADLLHFTLPEPFRQLGFGLLSSVLVLATVSAGLGALVLSRFGTGWSRQSPQAPG
jgi:hypothetical protein